MEKIPDKLYKEILENMPFPCVDLVIHKEKKVLLVYRTNNPEKNQWFVPGGRVLKNETLEQSAIRKAKEETGLNIEIEKKIGSYETFFKTGPFIDLKTGVHTINICFLATPTKENFEVKIDKTNSGYKWIDKIEEDLNPYVKQVLKDSKVFD